MDRPPARTVRGAAGRQWYHCATMHPADDHRPASAGARNGRGAPGAGQPQTPGQTASPAVPGAGGVVFDAGGRVLVLHHANGDWVFPKGHVEAGETPLQAALREVREEAGIEAECYEPAAEWVTRYRNAQGVLRHITWYVCRTGATATNVTEELFQEARFVWPEAALRLLTFEADQQLLNDVLAAGHPREGSHAP